MKKENPEDNKIRRKKASPSSKSSTRRPELVQQIQKGLLPLVILRQKLGLLVRVPSLVLETEIAIKTLQIQVKIIERIYLRVRTQKHLRER